MLSKSSMLAISDIKRILKFKDKLGLYQYQPSFKRILTVAMFNILLMFSPSTKFNQETNKNKLLWFIAVLFLLRVAVCSSPLPNCPNVAMNPATSYSELRPPYSASATATPPFRRQIPDWFSRKNHAPPIRTTPQSYSPTAPDPNGKFCHNNKNKRTNKTTNPTIHCLSFTLSPHLLFHFLSILLLPLFLLLIPPPPMEKYGTICQRCFISVFTNIKFYQSYLS